MGKTLLSFTGFHDPFAPGLIAGESLPGPVLTLAGSRVGFSRIVLLSTPSTEKITKGTAEALSERTPKATVETQSLNLSDPTNYAEILKGLKAIFTNLKKEKTEEFFIGISSGTPQMHACWLLLAASGEIHARILMTRPPKFVTKDSPLVQEVNFTVAGGFPAIRSRPSIAQASNAKPDLARELSAMDIVADDPKTAEAITMAATLAPTDLPVLILGETGTGKEVIARLIHNLSGREGPFVAVNCAAIPKELAESVLFGHLKGSFTGAISNQTGHFVDADKGTLFLDELGELPLEVQAKLLRSLQEKEVRPVGATKIRRVNVRVIAATNIDIAFAIDERRFREDLYHRLSGGEILLPPLRTRGSDISKIALQMLDEINKQQRKQRRFRQEALARLQRHTWPGNIRELRNVIERSVLLSQGEVLGPEDLIIKENSRVRDPFRCLPPPAPDFSMEDFLGKVRKNFFLRALEMAKGSQTDAARLLGVTPQAVNKFLKGNQP